jgi:PAS domain S-box-containing protein
LGCYKIGRLAAEGDPKLLTNDVANDPSVHDHEWAGRLGLVSIAGYRLLSTAGIVHGVLALFSKYSISIEEDAQLESLSGTTAQVIQTAIAQQAVKASEEKLSATLDTIPDPFVLYDTQGYPKYLNPAFTRTFGWSLDELRDKLIPFVPDEQKVIIGKKLAELYERGEPVRVESRRLTKDGLLIDVYISAALVKNSAKKPMGMVVTLTDITERKNLEKEREKLFHDLQDALENVRTLKGLLPICSHCKKVRDDKGYWNQIEVYIEDHSEAEFSHSICRECAKKYYPDMKIYDG